MAEYIEREALRSKAVYMHGFGKNKYVPLRAVEDTPAADVVPVVRCKDCWNTTEVDGYMGTVLYCHVCDRDVDGEHFCSYGERNGGDGNG